MEKIKSNQTKSCYKNISNCKGKSCSFVTSIDTTMQRYNDITLKDNGRVSQQNKLNYNVNSKRCNVSKFSKKSLRPILLF